MTKYQGPFMGTRTETRPHTAVPTTVDVPDLSVCASRELRTFSDI